MEYICFFVISGFVIFMTIEKIEIHQHFIINRVARLFPAYIFAVLLTYLVLSFFGKNLTILELIINLTMLQEFFGVNNIDGVYWTLTKEIIFYFLIYLVLFYKLKQVNNLLILFLIGLLVVKILSKVYSSVSFDYILFLGNYLELFIIGMVFYLIYKERKISIQHLIIFLLSLILCFGNMHYNNLIAAIIVSIFFNYILYADINFIRNDTLIYFGTISYSFYLIHNEIGRLVIDKTFLYVGSFGSCILAFLFSFILASIMYQLLEKKLSNYLKLMFLRKYQ